MKKAAIRIAAIASLFATPVFATPVLAADLPIKAPPPVVASGWTGFYVGGNLGVGIGRDPSTNPTAITAFGGVLPAPVGEQFFLSPLGVIGGGQVGYNWQATRNVVLGAEADFQGSAQRDSFTCVLSCLFTGVPANVFLQEPISQRLLWFGTVRGRAGWTNGPALFYATGGLAYGAVTTNVSFTELIIGLPGSTSAASANFTQDKVGWTVGAGVETQLIGNWSGKVEYLYINLGTVSGSVPVTGPIFVGVTGISTTIQDHIVRAGVNYKFGDPIYVPNVAPVYYKAPPPAAYNWSGGYVGGNIGLSVGRDPTTFSSFFFGANEQIFLSPLGVIGGGQVGYNWQVAPQWVLGAEADFQGSSERDSANCLGGCGPFPAFIAEGETITQRLNWFGTARGRAGWTDGPTLYYATGGFAYGNATTVYPSANQPLSAGGTQAGWTAGGGIETRLLGNWTGKIEYLYVDLGTESANTAVFPGLARPFPVSISSHIQDHVVRVGANYHW